MKQMLCVLVAALLLVALPWDNAQSRQYPYGIGAVDRASGDDHTWGGEQRTDPGPEVQSPGSRGDGTTGLAFIDFFLQKFFNKYIMMNDWQGSVGGSRIVVINEVTEEGNERTERVTGCR